VYVSGSPLPILAGLLLPASADFVPVGAFTVTDEQQRHGENDGTHTVGTEYLQSRWCCRPVKLSQNENQAFLVTPDIFYRKLLLQRHIKKNSCFGGDCS